MAVCKGWLYVDGFWYWFDDEGIMVVGLTECGSQTYYLNTGSDTSIPCGAMKTARPFEDDYRGSLSSAQLEQ